MSDDRLFASNNAIGRKWYFLNIIILVLIFLATNYVFNMYIIPDVTTEIYAIIASWMLYFLYAMYAITFFALIDRRLYDISGDRRNSKYKNVSSVLSTIVFFQLIIIACRVFNFNVPISLDLLQSIAWVANGVFLIIAFFLGFVRGRISNMSYEDYKNKLKYE